MVRGKVLVIECFARRVRKVARYQLAKKKMIAKGARLGLESET